MILTTKNSKLILTVLAMMISVAAFAQNLTVTGTVTDSSTGQPVPFAAIQLKDTMTGGMAAQLGEESIEVKITFNSDKTFSLSQVLGEGRAQEFSGTWQLTDKTLTGKYSNGKAWGSSYEVSVDNSTLTMVPESGAEAYIYRKTK